MKFHETTITRDLICKKEDEWRGISKDSIYTSYRETIDKYILRNDFGKIEKYPKSLFEVLPFDQREWPVTDGYKEKQKRNGGMAMGGIVDEWNKILSANPSLLIPKRYFVDLAPESSYHIHEDWEYKDGKQKLLNCIIKKI
jgi:hypothetical protein